MLIYGARCSGCILRLQRTGVKELISIRALPSTVFRVASSKATSETPVKHIHKDAAVASRLEDGPSAKFIQLDATKPRKLEITISESIAKPGSVVVEPVCSLPNTAAFEPISANATRDRLRGLLRVYAALSKFRLSALVVATSAGAYAVAPGAFDPVAFTACCVGTFLLSASANTWNQLIEINADRQMKRTSSRPLVTGKTSRVHACAFATATAVGGASLLAALTNEATLALGLANLFLYVCAYTPMKRIHYSSMYVGSLVGAIPPMMGWTAATGGLLTATGATSLLGSVANPLAYLGALVMPIVLFSWQFPHFNALSWNQRDDYARAGYRIMASECPMRARKTALSHSLILTAVCAAAPLTGVTTPIFALATAPVNAYLLSLALRFRNDADSQSSRRLFRFSLLYLPIVMLAMLATRAGDEDHDRDANNAVDA